MMKLSQLTKPNLIELHCDLTSKQDIIQLLTRKLYDEHKISDSQAFYQSVMDREKYHQLVLIVVLLYHMENHLPLKKLVLQLLY